jgi:DNA polymerase-3 subunit delta
MKLQTKQIEAFLKAPDKAVRAVLVYGPDMGLVRERAKILAQKTVPDITDPFNVAELTGDIVAADPARLVDEANARSLMGGVRLVRVAGAGNECAAPLKDWLLTSPGSESFIILEAGDLKPRDALRKLCEDAGNAAALPCYIEDERGIATLIREELKLAGFGIDADALQFMAQSIKGDRGRARSEIEKMILFMGPDPSSGQSLGRSINLDLAQQSVGDMGAQTLDDLIVATFSGQKIQALTHFRRLSDEGMEPIVLLRSLQNHVLRLHFVKNLNDLHGVDEDEGMRRLQPPVFFKMTDPFKAQLRRFRGQDLRRLLLRLNEIEAESKKTGTPVETLLSHFILQLVNYMARGKAAA